MYHLNYYNESSHLSGAGSGLYLRGLRRGQGRRCGRLQPGLNLWWGSDCGDDQCGLCVSAVNRFGYETIAERYNRLYLEVIR